MYRLKKRLWEAQSLIRINNLFVKEKIFDYEYRLQILTEIRRDHNMEIWEHMDIEGKSLFEQYNLHVRMFLQLKGDL